MLTKDNIFLNQKFNSKKDILEDIYNKFEQNEISKEYINSIPKRESMASFNIGYNIAIPHGTNEAMRTLRKSLIICYHLEKPILWDEQPVQIVLALAIREQDQIDTLQAIAVNAMDEEFFNDLLKNPTKEKFIQLSTLE